MGMTAVVVLASATNLIQGGEKKKMEQATFAGGCFWCMEASFKEMHGVTAAVSGYTGGHVKNPTYEQVCSGTTGHREAIEITFDPAQISYKDLVKEFWRNIDPTQADGQFADRGHQYQTAIYYHGEEQKKVAEESKKEVAASGVFDKPIVTEILPAAEFYPAEEYHQNYYKKCPLQYKAYKVGSGRAGFIERVWGKHPSQK
jgi:methionine-S-sulfoxide reductase